MKNGKTTVPSAAGSPAIAHRSVLSLSGHLYTLPAPANRVGHRVENCRSGFLVDNRTINGTATMLIDTDRCTGCDDCVHACAAAHDNNPRFVRHGLSHGPIQVVDQYRRLFQVLDELDIQRTEEVDSTLAIRLLALTGRRLGEILGLRWDQLDLACGTMHLEDTKTGAKDFVLAEPVVALLRQAKAGQPEGDVRVIRGRIGSMCLINLRKPWRRIRHLAGLDDVHIHDLRHSYAATAVGAGQDIRVVGAQLGHTQIQTTMRYAHVAQDPLRRATDQVSAAIAGFMGVGELS